jgi:hypothetical protein
VVSAGLLWARTGAVMSIIEQIQHPHIAKVTAQARVNQLCGYAAAVPHSLDAKMYVSA